MNLDQNSRDQDQLFVKLAQEGGIQALQALYEKYFSAIYRFCYWQTNSEPDAEDLTQEVFVAMTRSLAKFRGEASFKNWLYQIAKNIVAGWVRQKTQLKQVPLLEQLADTAEWIDPDNDAYKQKVVKKLLASLRAEERKVINYRFLRNYSVSETAHKLRISISNVKVMTHRALQKLRQHFVYPPKV